MKVITSIRLACAMSLMSLFFISSISCKKENSLASSPIVGRWLIYQSGEDDNQNGKLEASEWRIFTKNDYDILSTFGITGEVILNGDGTGKLVSSPGITDVIEFKWSIKADGTYSISDADPNSSVFAKPEPGETQTLYIDAKGDLTEETVRKFTTLGVVSTVASGNKYKRN
jgi:hypothetical protein